MEIFHGQGVEPEKNRVFGLDLDFKIWDFQIWISDFLDFQIRNRVWIQKNAKLKPGPKPEKLKNPKSKSEKIRNF